MLSRPRCPKCDARMIRTRRLRGLKASDTAAGVVVFSVTGEPEFGEFDAPVVLARYGEVPAELS
jgi:hypothetical protein